MAITLPAAKRDEAIGSIRRYFEENLDDEIGDLKAGLLLDYLLAEIAPAVYNQAIADAAKYMQERLTDLDGTCYEPEFGFWKTRRDPGAR